MAKRFCCCSTGSNLCCGDLTPSSGWINGPVSSVGVKYYRVSVPITFTNSYEVLYAPGAEHKGEIDCSIGGGCGGCYYDIPAPDGTQFGTSGGLQSLCLGLPCGGCKNGTCDDEDPPNCAPGDGSTCGPDCGENPNGCVSVCLPYEWEEACCGDDGVGGDDCGAAPSVLSLNEVLETAGNGTANFTVRTKPASDSVGCDCRFCSPPCDAGNPGFEKAVGSSSVPDSWYITDTEYRDTQWNGGDTSGTPCGSTPNCARVSVSFFCADEMLASSPSYRYHTPLGSLTAAPTNGLPYIDLNSYSGAWIARLSVVHSFETQNTLIVEGDRCTSVAEDQGSDGSVDIDVAFVGACGPAGVTFVPYAGIGARIGDSSTASFSYQSVSAGSFGISFDLDKWES